MKHIRDSIYLVVGSKILIINDTFEANEEGRKVIDDGGTHDELLY